MRSEKYDIRACFVVVFKMVRWVEMGPSLFQNDFIIVTISKTGLNITRMFVRRIIARRCRLNC